MAAKSSMFCKNTVVFRTFPRLLPPASSTACTFFSDWRVCSAMLSPANAPVAGSMGSWPDVMMMPAPRTPCEYGPMAAGACVVLMISFIKTLLFLLARRFAAHP